MSCRVNNANAFCRELAENEVRRVITILKLRNLQGKPMKKSKSSIYVRYEFSSESGNPEGGDILQMNSMADIQEMVAEILKVAHSDQVTVNLTIGQEAPFFGFLKKVGMSQKSIEK